MPSAFELPEGERNPYMYYEEYEAYLAYVNTCESPLFTLLFSSFSAPKQVWGMYKSLWVWLWLWCCVEWDGGPTAIVSRCGERDLTHVYLGRTAWRSSCNTSNIISPQTSCVIKDIFFSLLLLLFACSGFNLHLQKKPPNIHHNPRDRNALCINLTRYLSE